MPIQEKAYAKINLILDVTGKRPDGFHELRTVFQSLELHDTLTFSEHKNNQVVLTCDSPVLSAGSGNIAWRAAEALRQLYTIDAGVNITLNKQIPIAAGLGGGSSDAAAVLRGLIRFWGIPYERQRLLALSAQLGSDVPFCLEGGTVLGTGRGEMLSSLPPLPHFYVVLANPGFEVSTATIFQHLTPDDMRGNCDLHGMKKALRSADRKGIAGRLANVLERSTFRLYPAVRELKEKMNVYGTALMCGSGPTVFALYSNREEAENLRADLHKAGITAWLTETKGSYAPEEGNDV